MNLLVYMFPNEIELLIIIAIIYVFALFVFFRCVAVRSKARKNLDLLDEDNPNNIVDISRLKNYFEDPTIPTQEKTFDNFAIKCGKTSDTEPIFDHLNTMWAAKARGKSFDTEILVDKTVEKIFSGTDTIKAMISLFLVCGILGTLFGLAMSMSNFDPSNFITGDANSASLKELFSKLKSAFAPSINGVIATIVFVLGYTYFIQEKCINVLNQKLTVVTIKRWVPVLFPSESEESIKEINAAIDKANRISENYEEMDKGLDKVVVKLGEANETVSRVINASDALKDTATTFKDGAAIIGELNASVQTLSNQSNDLKNAVTTVVSQAVQNAATLHQNSVEMLSGSVKSIVNDSQGTIKAELEALQESFASQKQQLEAVIGALKLYDAHFAESNSKVQDGLVKSCQDINDATSNLRDVKGLIDEKDRKIMAAVGQPLQQQLDTLSNRIAIKLGEISVKVGSLQDPMSQAAMTIQTMFANMSRHNEELAKQMAKSGMTKEQIEAINKQLSQNITVDNTALEMKLDSVIKGIEGLQIAIKEAMLKKQDVALNSVTNTQELDYSNNFDILVNKLDKMANEKTNASNSVNKILPVAITALLFIGIIIQVITMSRLSDIAAQQANTTKVINELKYSQEKFNKELIEIKKTEVIK